MADTKRLAIELDKDTYRRLKLLAAMEERPMAALVRDAVSMALDFAQDDLYDKDTGQWRKPPAPGEAERRRKSADAWDKILREFAEGGEG